MKILHIDSSVAGDNSVSKKISVAAVANLRAANPGADVVYRDLGADPLPHLTLADLADHTLADEFLSADVVVIGAPMYNFTVPTNLKTFFGFLGVADVTFLHAEGLGMGPEQKERALAAAIDAAGALVA